MITRGENLVQVGMSGLVGQSLFDHSSLPKESAGPVLPSPACPPYRLAFLETYGILLQSLGKYLLCLNSKAMTSTLSSPSFNIIPSDDNSKCLLRADQDILMVKVSSDAHLVAYLTSKKLYVMLLSDFYLEESRPYRIYAFDNNTTFCCFSWLTFKQPHPDHLLTSQLLLLDTEHRMYICSSRKMILVEDVQVLAYASFSYRNETLVLVLGPEGVFSLLQAGQGLHQVLQMEDSRLKDKRFFVKNLEVVNDEYVFVMGMLSQHHLSTSEEDLTCQCHLYIFRLQHLQGAYSLHYQQEIDLSQFNESRVDDLPYQTHSFALLSMAVRELYVLYTHQSYSLIFLHRDQSSGQFSKEKVCYLSTKYKITGVVYIRTIFEGEQIGGGQTANLEGIDYRLDQLHSLLVQTSQPALLRYYTYHSQRINESQLPYNPHLEQSCLRDHKASIRQQRLSVHSHSTTTQSRPKFVLKNSVSKQSIDILDQFVVQPGPPVQTRELHEPSNNKRLQFSQEEIYHNEFIDTEKKEQINTNLMNQTYALPQQSQSNGQDPYRSPENKKKQSQLDQFFHNPKQNNPMDDQQIKPQMEQQQMPPPQPMPIPQQYSQVFPQQNHQYVQQMPQIQPQLLQQYFPPQQNIQQYQPKYDFQPLNALIETQKERKTEDKPPPPPSIKFEGMDIAQLFQILHQQQDSQRVSSRKRQQVQYLEHSIHQLQDIYNQFESLDTYIQQCKQQFNEQERDYHQSVLSLELMKLVGQSQKSINVSSTCEQLLSNVQQLSIQENQYARIKQIVINRQSNRSIQHAQMKILFNEKQSHLENQKQSIQTFRCFYQGLGQYIKGYNQQKRGLYTAKKHFKQVIKADLSQILPIIDNHLQRLLSLKSNTKPKKREPTFPIQFQQSPKEEEEEEELGPFLDIVIKQPLPPDYLAITQPDYRPNRFMTLRYLQQKESRKRRDKKEEQKVELSKSPSFSDPSLQFEKEKNKPIRNNITYTMSRKELQGQRIDCSLPEEPENKDELNIF